MSIDKEKIKDAFNKFEQDDFVAAKEILKQEIRSANNSYIEAELKLTKPINAPEPKE